MAVYNASFSDSLVISENVKEKQTILNDTLAALDEFKKHQPGMVDVLEQISEFVSNYKAADFAHQIVVTDAFENNYTVPVPLYDILLATDVFDSSNSIVADHNAIVDLLEIVDTFARTVVQTRGLVDLLTPTVHFIAFTNYVDVGGGTMCQAIHFYHPFGGV